jgi:hypothetical protein
MKSSPVRIPILAESCDPIRWVVVVVEFVEIFPKRYSLTPSWYKFLAVRNIL